MADLAQTLDLSALRNKGVQHLRGFFPQEVRDDLARRAQEVMELRETGRLTTFDQDSRGLPGEWFVPIIENEAILKVATSVLGPDVCSIGFRILAKGKHFKNAIHIHQDWPYNPGDTKKLTMFLPLTPVGRRNGGLIFLEESHLYGPQARGALDPSRFDPMDEVLPEAEVGDLLLCDFLTWHYSLPPEQGNTEERLMIQLNYQPASDASGTYLVAGKFPHNRRHGLPSRFEAVKAPSTDVNLPFARGFMQEGDVERAERYARGLIYDDPDHAGASLLLTEILTQKKDPGALTALEAARTAVRKMQAQIAAWDEVYGIASAPEQAQAATAKPLGFQPAWSALNLTFFSKVDDHPNTTQFPAILGTPEENWGYGAISDAIETRKASTVRVRARALQGKIGLCLLTDDCSALASEQQLITPEMADTTVMIPLAADKSPVRLLVRNFDDPGKSGKVMVSGIDLLELG